MSVHNPDRRLVEALHTKSDNEEISCADVFSIIGEIGAAPPDAGRALDMMGVSIIKCQLGLFGYVPEKKIVRPAENVAEAMRAEITAGLEGGKLPCARAWAIAEKLGTARMDVSDACETLGIKISRCQLGAF
jgi:hypothetical protein